MIIDFELIGIIFIKKDDLYYLMIMIDIDNNYLH